MTNAISKQQKDACANLFKINPETDKCLQLMPNGLLTLVTDDTEFTVEIGEHIIELVREGLTILEIEDEIGIAVATIFNWRDASHDDYESQFTKDYAIAYKESADSLEWLSLQEAIDKSGDLYSDVNKDGVETMRPNSAAVQRSRLKVDSLDKITESRDPGKYSSTVESEYGDNKHKRAPHIIIKHETWEEKLIREAEHAKEIEGTVDARE